MLFYTFDLIKYDILAFYKHIGYVCCPHSDYIWYVSTILFVQDMAAHSACDFGGGKAEKLALAKYRQAMWQGRVLNSQFTDEELRSQGRCPMTPEEAGLLLAALGFDNSTRLYLASHKVYSIPSLTVRTSVT